MFESCRVASRTRLIVRPPMSQDVRRFGHRDIAVRLRGGGQPCMVDSAVSKREATAFNLPRVPEYRWRIPLVGDHLSGCGSDSGWIRYPRAPA